MRWFAILTGVCAAIPVLAFALIVLSTLVRAWPAITQLGWQLFGPELATPFARSTSIVYGLMPPITGTLLVVAIALVLALPASLALALVARELYVPVLSRGIGACIGLLAGIPPIVYAVMAIFLIQGFMAPKLAAVDLEDARVRAVLQGLPAPDQLSLPGGVPNSTALGGLLLALLAVPVMAPLMDDALRAVPSDQRAASLALGANRWFTLWNVVLPAAVPGLVSAATLGALLAIGELVIPYFVIGAATNAVRVPSPIWDIFDKTPPLTSSGAGLMGGLSAEQEGVRDLGVSVAYAAGLMLLCLAFVVMALDSFAHQHLRSRIGR